MVGSGAHRELFGQQHCGHSRDPLAIHDRPPRRLMFAQREESASKEHGARRPAAPRFLSGGGSGRICHVNFGAVEGGTPQ